MNKLSLLLTLMLAQAGVAFAANTYQLKHYAPGITAVSGSNASSQSCSLPWGGTLANGASYTDSTVYSASSTQLPSLCSSLVVPLTCNNGQLSTPNPSTQCQEVDPYADKVTLLLKGDGAITDTSTSPKTLTNVNVTTTATPVKYGSGSLSFNGTTAKLPTTGSAFQFAMNGGDFTLTPQEGPVLQVGDELRFC